MAQSGTNQCLGRSRAITGHTVAVGLVACNASSSDQRWEFGAANVTVAQIRDAQDPGSCLTFNSSSLHMERCLHETGDKTTPNPTGCTDGNCRFSSIIYQVGAPSLTALLVRRAVARCLAIIMRPLGGCAVAMVSQLSPAAQLSHHEHRQRPGPAAADDRELSCQCAVVPRIGTQSAPPHTTSTARSGCVDADAGVHSPLRPEVVVHAADIILYLDWEFLYVAPQSLSRNRDATT